MAIETDYLLNIWAKSDPFHPLLYHMIDAGNVALSLLQTPSFKVIGDKFSKATGCPRENCDIWLAYLVAMHDIGKCDPSFQLLNDELAGKLKEYMPFPPQRDSQYMHEKSSSEWIRNILEGSGWARRSRNTIASSILLHHSRRSDSYILTYPEINKAWDAVKGQLAEELRAVFPFQVEPVDFLDNSEAGLLLSGLIVLSDWIASNEELIICKGLRCSTLDYARISGRMAETAISRLGFDTSISWQDKDSFSGVWPRGGFKELRPIQEMCVDLFNAEVVPRLMII